MRLEEIKSPGLAHTSYYLSDQGKAFVIDPKRDIGDYLKLAREDCASIDLVFETHRNEDYIIGSSELKAETGAEICHSKETDFKYGDHSLSDGEDFKLGNLKIEALYTPGHTFDSMCYVLYDWRNRDDPLMVFTGDTMFIGDVGRTDLPGEKHWEELSDKLYDSLHEKILPLGDHVIVHPAHTAGSICGSRISDREWSTIGYEKKTNPQLTMTREEFIEDRLNNFMHRPQYFRRMEEWNLRGAPLLSTIPDVKMVNPVDFDNMTDMEGTIVLDTREPDAFAASHIPGSINIWLWGASYFTGLVIDYDQRVLLVVERKEDAKTAVNYLHRIGYDDILGYLCVGLKAWRNAGRPTTSLGSIHAPELKSKVENNEVHVLDVREDHEWESGHIEGSQNIYVGHLQGELSRVPGDKPIVVHCGWGGRGGIAASILKRNGFENVYNLLGGMHAWRRFGYDVVLSN